MDLGWIQSALPQAAACLCEIIQRCSGPTAAACHWKIYQQTAAGHTSLANERLRAGVQVSRCSAYNEKETSSAGGALCRTAPRGRKPDNQQPQCFRGSDKLARSAFNPYEKRSRSQRALRCFPLCSDELTQMVLLKRGPLLRILKPGFRMRHPQRNSAQPNCGQRCGACQCRGLRAGPAGWTCGPEAAGLAGWGGPSAEGPRHRRSLQRLTCAKPGTETYPSTYVSLK